jgi:SAM-dependent methyltransferase
LTHDHAHDVRERRFSEGDSEAWEREVDPHELFEPAKRDIYNFIDETKIRHLRPMLPASGRAIEIGAGSGRLLIRAGLERPYRLVALDYAVYAMRAVRENAHRARRSVDQALGDARALPFRDASFDLVLSGGLLEHFRDVRPVLAEMARILRPGGLFYADIVPRKVSLYRWAERDRMQRSEHMAEGIYENDLSKGAWARLIRDVGLGDVRVISAGVYPPYTLPRYEQLTWRYASFVRSLDGTAVADVLGWFYMATARKT